MFLFVMIPTVDKPTRVTRQAASVIYCIITSSFIHTEFKSRIIEIDISDHFPIFYCYNYIAEKQNAKKKFINADTPMSQ